jgi:hypothetical protein
MVQMHDKRNGEDVDVFIAQDEYAVRGLAVLSTSREEVTVVNIVGTIDPRDIQRLREMASEARDRSETSVRVKE